MLAITNKSSYKSTHLEITYVVDALWFMLCSISGVPPGWNGFTGSTQLLTAKTRGSALSPVLLSLFILDAALKGVSALKLLWSLWFVISLDCAVLYWEAQCAVQWSGHNIRNSKTQFRTVQTSRSHLAWSFMRAVRVSVDLWEAFCFSLFVWIWIYFLYDFPACFTNGYVCSIYKCVKYAR